jgi:hypothetical protein
MARVALFLVSDDASYVSDTHVDGVAGANV